MINLKHLILFSAVTLLASTSNAYASGEGSETEQGTATQTAPKQSKAAVPAGIRSTELLFLRFNDRTTQISPRQIRGGSTPILVVPPPPMVLPLAPIPAENYIIRYPFVFIGKKDV